MLMDYVEFAKDRRERGAKRLRGKENAWVLMWNALLILHLEYTSYFQKNNNKDLRYTLLLLF